MRLRPLIWWNQRKVGGRQKKDKARERKNKEWQYRTTQSEYVRQMLNYSLLIYNNKIIWLVEYVPIFSRLQALYHWISPTSVSFKAKSPGERVTELRIKQYLLLLSPGEWSMGFLFACKSLNLQEYVSSCQSHLGQIKMQRFFCYLSKQNTLQKRIWFHGIK